MVRKHEYRILFLKQFTKELIIKSKTEQPGVGQVQAEIPISEQKEFEINVPIKKTEEIHKEFRPEYIKLVTPPKPPQKPRHRLSTLPPRFSPQKPKLGMTMPLEKGMRGMQPSITDQQAQRQIRPQSEFTVRPQATGKIIDLKRLNQIVRDPRVTLLECPGPGKFILVKTGGQTTVTKISLSSEEIQNIIDTFSQESKVPLISGLFKAAVGNMVITAVISELVGSRFIINKLTPRSMIEQRASMH